MLRIVSLAAALLFAGCTTYNHPTKTRADFVVDKRECEAESSYRQDVRTCLVRRGWKRGRI
jgi:hypothetical protein